MSAESLCFLSSDVDECQMEGEEEGHNCDPYADCLNKNGSFKCLCMEGYSGNGTICQSK